jgi:hypothetical protein
MYWARRNGLRSIRFQSLGLVIVIVVLGAALIVMTIGRSGTQVDVSGVDVLANSDDECVECHKRTTPGIVEQYSHSTMAVAEVTCRNCRGSGLSVLWR